MFMNEQTEAVISDVQLERAEAEAYAEAGVIQALKRVSPGRRKAVLDATMLLLEADRLVPGVFELFTNKRRKRDDGADPGSSNPV